MEKYYIYESKVKLQKVFLFVVIEVLLLIFVIFTFSSEEAYYVRGYSWDRCINHVSCFVGKYLRRL